MKMDFIFLLWAETKYMIHEGLSSLEGFIDWVGCQYVGAVFCTSKEVLCSFRTFFPSVSLLVAILVTSYCPSLFIQNFFFINNTAPQLC